MARKKTGAKKKQGARSGGRSGFYGRRDMRAADDPLNVLQPGYKRRDMRAKH